MARPIDPEKRLAILKAARKVILEDGLQSAKISKIASEAGVASGTVYLYFESKEAIAAALATDFYERAGAIMERLVPHLMEENGIENYIDASAQFAAAEKDILLQIRPNPRVAYDVDSKQKRQDLQEQMAGFLQDLMDREKIEPYDPRALSSIIFGIMNGIIMGAVIFEDMPLSLYKETTAKLLRKALRPVT